MTTMLRLLALTSGALLFSGCTFPSRTSIYDRNSAGRSMSVDTGDIVAVREVQISGRNTVVGVGGGGLMGRAAASGGSGVGGAVVQAAGTIAGAVAGEAVEEVATRKAAQEITVKLSNGDTVAIVQEVRNEGRFNVGERVQVLHGAAGSTVRKFY